MRGSSDSSRPVRRILRSHHERLPRTSSSLPGRPEGLHYNRKCSADLQVRPHTAGLKACTTTADVVRTFRSARHGPPEGLHDNRKWSADLQVRPTAGLKACTTTANGVRTF